MKPIEIRNSISDLKDKCYGVFNMYPEHFSKYFEEAQAQYPISQILIWIIRNVNENMEYGEEVVTLALAPIMLFSYPAANFFSKKFVDEELIGVLIERLDNQKHMAYAYAIINNLLTDDSSYVKVLLSKQYLYKTIQNILRTSYPENMSFYSYVLVLIKAMAKARTPIDMKVDRRLLSLISFARSFTKSYSFLQALKTSGK